MKDNGNSIAINWHYIVVSVFFTAVITLLVIYLPNMRELDYSMMKWVQSVVNPFPQIIILLISEFGRYQFIWPILVASGILVSHRYYLQTAMLIIFTQLADVLTDWLKGLMCRERPCGDALSGFSYPSGHALINMCFFGILIYLVSRHVGGFMKHFLITIFVIFIALVGISRLCLGVHFPTDILAGMFIGFILVNLYIILDKTFGG